jgi:hypothetical protein
MQLFHVAALAQRFWGKLVGDKSYLLQRLAQELLQRLGVQLLQVEKERAKSADVAK